MHNMLLLSDVADLESYSCKKLWKVATIVGEVLQLVDLTIKMEGSTRLVACSLLTIRLSFHCTPNLGIPHISHHS